MVPLSKSGQVKACVGSNPTLSVPFLQGIAYPDFSRIPGYISKYQYRILNAPFPAALGI